ncbi:glucan biosynthesis protein [Thioclava pacifica]|uniref:glucan biosynthesis protein n=1 Tax=Thioclava pacifica TaxID=285109 RepID=UPI000570B250|nr:glucan biosynthesis protein [Thioclava pacifica]
MPHSRTLPVSNLTRRQLLRAGSAMGCLAAAGLVPRPLMAQDAQPAGDAAPATAAPAAPQQTPFSFDALAAEMQQAAKGDPVPPATSSADFLSKLTYDSYRLIRFDPAKARFADIENTRFELQAFHLGWLFKEPVQLFTVEADQSRPMEFNTDDFIYEREARQIVPEHAALPGVAGFRLHSPINRPDIMDELIAFQGASYFRALGRGSAYGLSARGLAVNTGLSVAEEFPRFTRFWIETPQPGANTITVYAAMNSQSLTGAYRFVITPGEATVMDVTARLFIRADIQQLGVAPLTSMFLYGPRNRSDFDDYRPKVHDSDGLAIEQADGDKIWRPLQNPGKLASSYFSEVAPKSFGLYQRDRDFDHYQDASAHYERRPSVRVTPKGDWGKGMVRLVEIPSNLEVNDNIVAFWVPEAPAKAGDALEFAYRLEWGDLPPDPADTRAHIEETRAGEGGVSGVENTKGTRKFVIDFKDGEISRLPGSAADKIKPVTHASKGKIVTQTLSKVEQDGVWRLVLDVSADGDAPVELSAHLSGFGRSLSETWLYQWNKS